MVGADGALCCHCGTVDRCFFFGICGAEVAILIRGGREGKEERDRGSKMMAGWALGGSEGFEDVSFMPTVFDVKVHLAFGEVSRGLIGSAGLDAVIWGSTTAAWLPNKGPGAALASLRRASGGAMGLASDTADSAWCLGAFLA